MATTQITARDVFNALDYCSRSNAQKAQIGGFTVTVMRDECAGNPWKEWDGNAPLIALVGNGYRSHTVDNSGKYEIANPLHGMTDSFITRKQKEICQALDYDHDSFHAEAKDYAKDYRCALVEAKRDLLNEYFADSSDSDRLEVIKDLWLLQGVYASCKPSCGYSQGDYADVLVVLLPQWLDDMGITDRSPDSLAGIAQDAHKLYSAWAWGDVYCYTIEDSEGDLVDSDGGYYGDHMESGLCEVVADALNHAAPDSPWTLPGLFLDSSWTLPGLFLESW